MPGVVLLKICPEAPDELVRAGHQSRVVDGGPAFLQVVDDQVPDRAARDLVAVDQLLCRALAGAADLPQRRDIGPEDAHLPQDPEGRRAGVLLHPQRHLGIQGLQDIADGDVGEHAAPGRGDNRHAELHHRLGGRADAAVVFAEPAQPPEPGGIPEPGHSRPELARPAAGQQPRQRRPDDVGADQEEQGAGHQLQLPRRRPAVAAQPPGRACRPALPRGVRAAGQPAFLPRPAGLLRQPAQPHRQALAAGAQHRRWFGRSR
jgi:hypothetical protein